MGCLRLVGALKLQVSFGDCRLFDRALLQKRPVISRRLLIVDTPYLSLLNDRSLLQNIVSFMGLFCKRDL